MHELAIIEILVRILPKTRKGVIKLMYVIIGICLTVASIIGILWFIEQNTKKDNDTIDFTTLPIEQVENVHALHGTIDVTVGSFMECYTTYSEDKTAMVTNNQYYLIPVYSVDENDIYSISYFIAFDAHPKDFKTMEKIEEQTWTDVSELTELKIDNATIEPLTDEDKGYLNIWISRDGFYEGGSFVDWCAQYNILNTTDKATIRCKVVPYLIRESPTGVANLTVAWVFLGIAVCALVIILVAKHRKPIIDQDDTADSGCIQLKNEDEKGPQ